MDDRQYPPPGSHPPIHPAGPPLPGPSQAHLPGTSQPHLPGPSQAHLPGPSQAPPPHHLPPHPLHPQQPPPVLGGGGFVGSGGAGPLPGSSMDADAATRMWAQDGYMLDSGIASGSNTAAPSVMSGASSLHHQICQDPYSGPPTPYEGFPSYLTPQQQIHAAAFPGKPTSQADVNVNEAIPELVRLLSDADKLSSVSAQSESVQAVVGHAAKLVTQLAKQEGARKEMSKYPELVRTVVDTMSLWDDPAGILKDSAHVLYVMSQDEKGLEAIFKAKCIKTLVHVLDAPVEKWDESKARSLVYYAVITLHNLIVNQPGGTEEARQEGLLTRLVNLLSIAEEKFLSVVTDCIRNLIFEQPELKLVFLQCGGTPQLVHIVRTMQYEKLLLTTARSLKALSTCPQNKVVLVSSGAIQALQVHLGHASHRLITVCLTAIQNLSDEASRKKVVGLEPLLDSCLNLLGSSDSNIVNLCCGILRNLPCNNQPYKVHIVRQNGINYILRVFEYFLDYFLFALRQGQQPSSLAYDIVENSLASLRHLTIRHEEASTAQAHIKDLYQGPRRSVFVILSDMLMPKFAPLLIKEALGLVKNLGANPYLGPPIAESNVIVAVSGLLKQYYMDYYESQMKNVPPPVADGVSVVTLLETCVGALGALAECPIHRRPIVEAGNLPYFVNLLSMESDNMKRLALTAITHLAEESVGTAMSLEDPLSQPAVQAALQDPNPPIPQLAEHLFNVIQQARKHVAGGSSGSSGGASGSGWSGGGAGTSFAPDADPDEPFTDMFYQKAVAESSFDPQEMDMDS